MKRDKGWDEIMRQKCETKAEKAMRGDRKRAHIKKRVLQIIVEAMDQGEKEGSASNDSFREALKKADTYIYDMIDAHPREKTVIMQGAIRAKTIIEEGMDNAIT